jgi:chromosome condensin MukBEF MukE localization factor
MLVKLKLEPIREKPYIYVTLDRKVFIVFFVDEIQIIYHRDNIELIKAIIKGLY